MSSDSRRHVFSQIGGHTALDLVNTVEWRLAPERLSDDLRDYDDVVRWASQLGVVSPDERDAIRRAASRDGATAEKESVLVHEVREALYDTLFAGGDPGILVDQYAEAVAQGRLTPGPSGWTWNLPVDLGLPRRRIALEAFDLLTRADLSVLAQCQDADCGWVFLDTSPRHNRRWCVAADCGNRNRAREFYRRSRSD
jgi:predicted RNA-binding Zn ribbon-like protein